MVAWSWMPGCVGEHRQIPRLVFTLDSAGPALYTQYRWYDIKSGDKEIKWK